MCVVEVGVGARLHGCLILDVCISLALCLSVKLLVSPSYLNEILAGYSNLGCRLFSFITLYVLPFPPGLKSFY